ncbi:hypothetical protein C0995_009113 [Termitomyces sp. Mi166|nr:hypothetical protein C0995_009113 [Termitomyces sp. Mi166\
MGTTPLASLSLFVATPDQILESRRRTALHWGRGLLLEEYLAREEFIDKQEVARDGRLITWVLAPRSDPTSLDFLSSCKTYVPAYSSSQNLTLRPHYTIDSVVMA